MKIETIEGFTTEGVLIFANITKCKEYYSDKEFNYSYPEGLSDLLTKGIIYIITTDESVEQIDFTFEKEEIDLSEWKYQESYNYLNVEKDDEIRLISHAAFTQMCHNHKGNLEAQIESSLRIRNIFNPDNPLDKDAMLKEEFPILDLPVGNWKVNVYNKASVFSDEDWDFYLYPEFTIHFEAMNYLDLDKISLQPLELYSEN